MLRFSQAHHEYSALITKVPKWHRLQELRQRGSGGVFMKILKGEKNENLTSESKTPLHRVQHTISH